MHKDRKVLAQGQIKNELVDSPNKNVVLSGQKFWKKDKVAFPVTI